MATSDLIASFILNAIDGSDDGFAELQRSALAEMFSCVPSQINYVISTRFSPERGYLVESRRGGGGYIRITRVNRSPRELVMHTVNAVGDALDEATADALIRNIYDAGLLDRKTARILLAATGNKALHAADAQTRDRVRAGVLKYMLVALVTE